MEEDLSRGKNLYIIVTMKIIRICQHNAIPHLSFLRIQFELDVGGIYLMKLVGAGTTKYDILDIIERVKLQIEKRDYKNAPECETSLYALSLSLSNELGCDDYNILSFDRIDKFGDL